LPVATLYEDVLTLYALSGTGATPTHVVNYGGAWGEQIVWTTEDVPNDPKYDSDDLISFPANILIFLQVASFHKTRHFGIVDRIYFEAIELCVSSSSTCCRSLTYSLPSSLRSGQYVSLSRHTGWERSTGQYWSTRRTSSRTELSC
jgi:hypothetical protein